MLLATPGVATATPELVPWGRRDLSIPYRWSSTNESRAASEVVLYVSPDRGQNWSKVASATPLVRSFLYQAPTDGEFWFAVRTYDRYGGCEPTGPLRPEMRVAIDTQGPRIVQFSGVIERGVLRAVVDAQDGVAIDTASVQMFAQVSGSAAWTPIPVTTGGATHGDSRRISATGEWRPPIGASEVQVKVSLADRAGARTESITIASAGRGGDHEPRPEQAPLEEPKLAAAFASARSPAAPSKNPFDRFDAEWEQRYAPPRQEPRASSDLNTRTSAPEPEAVAAAGVPTWRRVDSQRGAASQGQPWTPDVAPTQPLQATAGRAAIRDTRDTPFGLASLHAGGSAFAPPSNRASKPIDRHVNSTEFEFDYQLADTGDWGVSNVELWGTEDGGATWRRFAIDSDLQSPIHVSVDHEGDYGFTIVVESIGGLAPRPPRPGDTPEVRVRVDRKKPGVLLTRVEQGLGYMADQVTIDWRIDEEHPAPRGVDLYYSNRPTGPWAPIATGVSSGGGASVGVAGAGRYSWRLQRHLPDQLYIRVEARDLAGNVGAMVSAEPVVINLPEPSGALLGVRAVAD